MTTTAQAAAPKPMDPLQAGIQLFNETKTSGDPDLVQNVRDMLATAGVKEEILTTSFDGNRFIKDAVNKHSIVQRVQINRFADLALKGSHENTTAMRAELLPSGPLENWLKQMDTEVVPFIATRKLLGE